MEDWWKLALGALLVVIGVATFFTYFGKGSRRQVPDIEGPPARHLKVESSLPPAQALARIKSVTAAGKAKISVAAEEPARSLVVLSDEQTLKSFANFYPCFASARGNGSEIVVGILPPPPQAGPAVKKRLQRMAEAVRVAVN